MEWNVPCVEEDLLTDGRDDVTATSDEYVDFPMPDVRSDWRTANQNNKLGGCWLHKNFTYEELCGLEESLFQRRVLADVPTPDVQEYHERLKRQTQFKAKRCFKAVEQPKECEASRDEVAKEIKERLKAEVLKELLAELKGS